MKRTTISHLIMLLKRIKSPFALRKRLNALRTHGLSLTDIPSSRRLSWSVVFSSCFSLSSDSLETQDCAQPALTSAVMNKHTSQQTRLSVNPLVLNLTRSSISLDELRLLGCFNPSKGKQIKSICRQTSGWQVQIACTPVAKRKT